MAKSIYFAAASLDGFIADENDAIDWLTGFESEYDGPGDDAMEAIDAFVEKVGAIVMGSSTYEFLVAHGHWPYGARPAWVLTSRDLAEIDAHGADVRFRNGPVVEIHPEMVAAAGGRHLWVMGGAPVASPLAEAGLLDELHVTVVPIVLGSGKPLFESPILRPMRLLGTRAFSNGMYELRYSLAG